MNLLFFDTETTGKPLNYRLPMSQVDNWPRLVQIGWIQFSDGSKMSAEFIVKPDGFVIPQEATNVHQISQEEALLKGVPVKEVVDLFASWIALSDAVIGHNITFDVNVFGAEYWRLYGKDPFAGKKIVDTMTSSTNYCKIQGSYGYKWPKLSELYQVLFEKDMGHAHTALADIENTASCYFELVKRGVLQEIA